MDYINLLECPVCKNKFYKESSREKKFCCKKCKTKYHNRTKRGLAFDYISPLHLPPEQRFWLKVNKDGPIPDENKYGNIGTCWSWIGKRDQFSYGTIRVNKKEWKAHRYSYFLHFGEIPKDHEICHKCDNPSCVRPEHLWADTHRNNMLDCYRKGRYACSINFNIINNTNLDLLSNENLNQAIENLQKELDRRRNNIVQ